jgi:hypothetical protein
MLSASAGARNALAIPSRAPALAPPLGGSPLERLHQSVVNGAEWLHSKDPPVAVRLISDVQEDPVLRRLFLERFYLPR